MYSNFTQFNTLCKGKKCDDLYKEVVIYYETDDNLTVDIKDLKYKFLKDIICTKCN